MSRQDSDIVLVVDNNEFVLDSVSALLATRKHHVLSADSAARALSVLSETPVNIVLSDVVMPDMTGLELLERIRETNREMPVILMTAHADVDMMVEAIRHGAFDFILKPFRGVQLLHTVDKAIQFGKFLEQEKHYKKILEETVAARTNELARALHTVNNLSREIVERLTAVAEYKDTETGMHINRIGEYAQCIAEHMNLPQDFIDTITFASPMHDIGKIGIPDHIILKPGPHTPDEAEIVKKHTVIGERMLSGSAHDRIKLAASIALSHHERYDGTGYPYGLQGHEIPLEGRIVIVCDQYDALRSKRPYKDPLSHEDSLAIILNGDDRTRPEHFDPVVLKAFEALSPVFETIFSESQDAPQDRDPALQ